MSFTPVFAVAALLIGLLAFLPTAWLPFLRPYRRFITPAAVGISFLGVLFTPLEQAQPVLLTRWQPSALFGAFPTLLARQEIWPLVLALSGAALAAALVQLSRVPQPDLPLQLSAPWMLVTGLASLWGENMLTVLIAWAAFDLAWGLGAAASGLPVQRVAFGVGLNGLATVLLWAATLLADGRGSISWTLADLNGLGGNIALLAALLRLGLYPLHLALPAEDRWNLPASTMLLMSPSLGWGLLADLAAAGQGALPLPPWLEGVAIATFVGGGLLAWTRTNRGGGWPWASLAGIGGVLWAICRAGDAVLPALTAGGVAWTLGVGLLHLDRGLDRGAPWWSAGAALGGLALLGAPLTPGLIPSASLLEGLASSPTLGRTLAFLTGHALLTAAIARRVMREGTREETNPLYVAARAAGVILPSLILLIVGLLPSLFGAAGVPLAPPGAVGWGLWTAGLVMGVLLFWQGRGFRQQLRSVLGLLHDIFRLEWLIHLILRSLDRASAFLGAVADVAEGPGAILWALSIFFLILLAIVGR